MQHSLTQLYVHLVWATHERLPLIVPAVEPLLYAVILAKCRDCECHVLALGGIEDHVHLFVQFPATISIARLTKEVKGASSHFMNHEGYSPHQFRWQGGYGAFTVGKRSQDLLVEYVCNQKKHHNTQQLIGDLEVTSAD